MASIRREAEQPAPLPFPWWRFAAGIAASGGMAAATSVLLSQSAMLAAPVPAAIPAILYALAMLLIGLGVAAMPRVLSQL